MDRRKETRLTVVDESGRVYEKYNIIIDESIQDDGRTLKLFVSHATEEKVIMTGCPDEMEDVYHAVSEPEVKDGS